MTLLGVIQFLFDNELSFALNQHEGILTVDIDGVPLDIEPAEGVGVLWDVTALLELVDEPASVLRVVS
jgi:hypothetical protein